MVAEGKFTVETFAHVNHLTRQSALNKLSKLKKEGFVSVNGGGRQKRIYTVRRRRSEPTNGFYDMVNKYSPEKLQPAFEHYVIGRYTVENAIVDGVKIGDVRTLEATMHLFRHVHSWKRLFDLAKKNEVERQVRALYSKAQKSTKTKRMPKRYR